MKPPSDKGRNGRPREDPAKRRLEAIAACIGAVIALATLGIIVRDGLTRSEGLARIVAEAGAVEPYPGGHILEVIVRNEGDETAAGVMILGELRRGQEVVETNEITLDYVASRSHRRGGMFFTQDPSAFELDLRATGYSVP